MSKPMGERLSTKVATVAAARAGKIFSETENGYSAEKKIRLIVRLKKLAKNIVVEPSKLLSATSLNFLLPCLSPTIEAALSP